MPGKISCNDDMELIGEFDGYKTDWLIYYIYSSYIVQYRSKKVTVMDGYTTILVHKKTREKLAR